MDDARDEFPNARECREQQLRDFVSKYKDLKCLWDIRCKDYSNRDQKKDAYSELLVVYKLIKPEASIDDVKKKIQSFTHRFLLVIRLLGIENAKIIAMHALRRFSSIIRKLLFFK